MQLYIILPFVLIIERLGLTLTYGDLVSVIALFLLDN